LATPIPTDGDKKKPVPSVTAEHSARLESWIDEASAAIPPLKAFILPGGTVLSAHLHVGRTICRRAERAVVTLAGTSAMNPQVLIYLNRLSDLLFAWARHANHLAGVADVPWQA
jgi:cob(I)alamin adenosyltransferase